MVYVQVYPKVHNIMMIVYNASKRCPFLEEVGYATVHYYNITKNFAKQFNFTRMVNYTKNYTRTYLPVAVNVSRMYVQVGYNMSRRFAIKVSSWNSQRDFNKRI